MRYVYVALSQMINIKRTVENEIVERKDYQSKTELAL